VPYVTGSTITTGGQLTTSSSRQDVGIKLEVTPQINPDGFVRMEIRQEVSDIAEFDDRHGSGSDGADLLPAHRPRRT
jgi:type II secretory pathway component GspD/PulD (secretin)